MTISLDKLHDNFCIYAELERNLSLRTIIGYKEAYKCLRTHFIEKEFIKPELENLTSYNIKNYLYDCKRLGHKTNTIYNRFKSIKSFCTYLVKEEILEKNPFDKIEKPKLEKTLPNFLTEDEARRLLRYVTFDAYPYKKRQKRDRVIIGMFLYCGLRKSELLNLKESDLLLDEGFVKVVQGKGAKDRMVPLNALLTKWIIKYMEEKKSKGTRRDYLFVSSNRDSVLSSKGLNQLYKDLQRSGVKTKFSSHTLRHTFATLMVKGGSDIVSVKEILGHAKLETTMIYMHTNSEQLTKAIKYHPLAG